MDPNPYTNLLSTDFSFIGSFTKTFIFLFFAVLLHSFFVLANVAILRSRRNRIEELQEAKRFGAKKAWSILDRSENYLLCCQFLSFATSLVIGGVCFSILPASGNLELCYLVTFRIVLFLVVLIFATMFMQIAKAAAYAKPNRTLCTISPILGVFYLLSNWIIVLIRFVTLAVTRLLKLKTLQERDYAITAEEISEIMELSTKAGQLEEDEHDMIKGVFEFADTIAVEVMTPRKDVIAVPITASLVEVVKVFGEEGHTRILVYGKDLDDFKGILNAKDLVPFAAFGDNGKFTTSQYIREVAVIPGNTSIQDALAVLKRESSHFAVVLDEHGGLDGILTVEDIIEQIVGDIYDEYDIPEEESVIEETASGELILDGSALIDDINSEYDLDLPVGEYDTIAGFIINQLGKIPTVGEIVLYNNYQFIVEEVVNNRISTLRFSKKHI